MTDITYRLLLPRGYIGDAAAFAVDNCPALRMPLADVPYAPRPERWAWEPRYERVDVDITDAVMGMMRENKVCMREKTTARLACVEVEDVLGNVIPNARIVARYAMEATD